MSIATDLQTIEYLQNYMNQCWENRKYHEDRQNKLVYWVASFIVGSLTAGGLFGVFNNPTNKISATTFLFLAFGYHLIFIIAWLFVLYQRLNVFTYEKIGAMVESQLVARLGLYENDKSLFCEIKFTCLGKFFKLVCARNFILLGGVLFCFFYATVIIYFFGIIPHFEPSSTVFSIFRGREFTINLDFNDIKNCVYIIMFGSALIATVAFGAYSRSKRNIKKKIKEYFKFESKV